MITIYKYKVPVRDGVFEVALPRGARPCHVGVQFDEPCLWARVETNNPPENQKFCWVGTGHPAPEKGYLGTIQMHGGALVFHLFRQEP